MQRRIHGGKVQPSLFLSLIFLIGLYTRQGRHTASGSLLEEAVAELRRQHGAQGHPQLARMLAGLAMVYVRQGRFNEAVPLRTEALAMLRRSHGRRDDRTMADTLWCLANVYQAQRRLDEAALLHEEALAMRRRMHIGATQGAVLAPRWRMCMRSRVAWIGLCYCGRNRWRRRGASTVPRITRK